MTKFTITCYLILILVAKSFAQDITSTEGRNYNDSIMNSGLYIDPDYSTYSKEALNATNLALKNYATITKISNPATYKDREKGNKFNDSLEIAFNAYIVEYAKTKNKEPNELVASDTMSAIVELATGKGNLILAMSEKIATTNISKTSIIKEEIKNNEHTILYVHENGILKGYWIAFSANNGKSWTKLYTGLSDKFFTLKTNSTLPLLKNASTLQVEAATHWKTGTKTNFLGDDTYEIINDSLLIEFDLEKLKKDSDNDGLTDITEEKLTLNPQNNDTDGDGIIDSKDFNPKFKSIKNSHSIIYNTYFNHFNSISASEKVTINAENVTLSKVATLRDLDSLIVDEDYQLIVSNQSEIQNIDCQNKKFIILNSEDYENTRYTVLEEAYPLSFSKMYPCDKAKKTFVIKNIDEPMTTIVKQTLLGWEIFTEESIMMNMINK